MPRLAPVAIVVVLLIAAGAWLLMRGGMDPPVPDPDAISLVTQRNETVHYPVTGATAQGIFESIEASGPTNDAGVKGSGLTEARWSYTWRGQTERGYCLIESMTISLELTVTLPKHVEESDLADSVATRWRDLVNGITVHEERHAEIYLEGAQEMTSLMADIGAEDDCEVLEAEIQRTWTEQQALINQRQERFHAEEEERLAAQRGPLEQNLQSSRARLSALTGEIRTLDASISTLGQKVEEERSKLTALQTQLDQIEQQYPQGLPPSVASQYEEIRAQYNAGVPAFNVLVGRYNEVVEQRSLVLEDYDDVLTETNQIFDDLYWLR